MNRLLSSFLWLLTAFTVASAAETTNLTFHVQLVRGADEATPPTKDSKAIGPKLDAKFQQCFKFKHYWQIQYREVHLAPGKSIKLRLSPEREVEIDLAKPGQRIVTAFSNGNAIACTVDRLNASMTLIGGKRDAQSVWFIAVRPDKPSTD